MIDNVPHIVEGNEAVRTVLDHWTKKAAEGKLNFVAVIGCTSPTDVQTGHGGVGGMEFAINGALTRLPTVIQSTAGEMQYAAEFGADLLKDTVKGNLMNRSPPELPAGQMPTADRVTYNVSKLSCSYDFVTWFVAAEMNRIREGAPYPLKVHWYFGQNGNQQSALASAQRAENFENIMRPMLQLFGAVEAQDGGRNFDQMAMQPIVEAYNNGEALPKFQIPQQATDGLKGALDELKMSSPVTITLRECDHHIHRNSNVTEWIKLAEWLKERGEKVIFVRDTAKARDGITGHATCPPASLDIVARTALYSLAKVNLGVANGPMMLAVMMNDKPWLMFNELQEEGLYYPNTFKGWKHFTGVEPGEQWPWCKPNQRIIMAADKFETMRDAWLEHIEPQLSAAA